MCLPTEIHVLSPTVRFYSERFNTRQTVSIDVSVRTILKLQTNYVLVGLLLDANRSSMCHILVFVFLSDVPVPVIIIAEYLSFARQSNQLFLIFFTLCFRFRSCVERVWWFLWRVLLLSVLQLQPTASTH